MQALNVLRVVNGIGYFFRGLSWLSKHPGVLSVLFVPMLLGLILTIAAFSGFMSYDSDIMTYLMFDNDGSSFWWNLLYYLVFGILYVSAFIVALLFGVLFSNILSAPIYEWVSMKVEFSITGKQPAELSIIDSLKLIGEEIKKILFILGISIFLLLIPGLNVISSLATAFLLGWEFIDITAARQGWKFGRRLNFATSDTFAVLGLGLLLVIPFVQIVLMPLGVVGGTLLAIDNMQAKTDVSV